MASIYMQNCFSGHYVNSIYENADKKVDKNVNVVMFVMTVMNFN